MHMTESSQPITSLLHRMRQGDRDAGGLAMQSVYAELHRLAGRFMRREAAGHTLQPTALVNEAYLRLARGEAADPKDRQHFVAMAATVMRRILVDHARQKQADKRGAGARKVQLEDVALAAPAGTDLVELDELLDQLAVVDGRAAQVVEYRFFAGCTEEETALQMDQSQAQTRRDWDFARTWLKSRLMAPGRTGGSR
jgi:RNA polymerase sigma factor (TIGR02999 family)